MRMVASTAIPRSRAIANSCCGWVVERAFGAEEVLDESDTNERLARFTGDVAALRRYLVDAGLLERTRSGSEYARPGASPG